MKRFACVPFLLLAACSSPAPETAEAKAAPITTPGPATTESRHPFAKHIELAGFRLRETGAGKLEIKLAAINHSAADLGDVTLTVKLVTNEAKPEDPPVTEFEVQVPAWGPSEVKDVTASASTKLRIYELPDWQFLRASFDITAPPPQ